jgi:DUF4097 and DUF4098 domain-containing protein YvlB
MKSAYELAMERLEKKAPSVSLTDEQKQQIAEIDSTFKARIAKGVSFKSSRTDMDFTQLEGSLNLDSGDLEADGVNGPLRLRTRSKDIRLNGTSSDLHLENENGAIEVHVNKMGSMEIKNSRGDIRVFLPEKAGFQVEAQARDGEIIEDRREHPRAEATEEKAREIRKRLREEGPPDQG